MRDYRYWTLEVPKNLQHLDWKGITSQGTHLFTVSTDYIHIGVFDAPTLRMTLRSDQEERWRGSIFQHGELKVVGDIQYGTISATDFWPLQKKAWDEYRTKKLIGVE